MASPYSPTQHQLEEWLTLVHDVAERWGDHMDEYWLDLPPEVCEAIYAASHAFGDAADTIDKYLDSEKEDLV